MSPRQRLAVLCVVTSTVAFTPPLAVAAGTVGAAQINAAVLPINVADAVLPIDLGGSVQPLEVQRTQGSTSVITVSADVLFAFDTATLTPPATDDRQRRAANPAPPRDHDPRRRLHRLDRHTRVRPVAIPAPGGSRRDDAQAGDWRRWRKDRRGRARAR